MKNIFKHAGCSSSVFLSSSSLKAFTLSEILVTLGILGVVAIMAVPPLLQNSQDQATVTAVKKANSTLSDAFTRAVQENGTPDAWGATTDDGPGSQALMDKIKPYLNVQKDCGTGGGCFPTVKYKRLSEEYGAYQNLDSSTSLAHIQLRDGSLIALDIYSISYGLSSGQYAVIIVDTNGFKAPNQFGVDTFIFWLTQNKILPGGAPRDQLFSFSQECNRKLLDASTNGSGSGCAGWVITNGNLDYRYVDDLNWSTKTHK